MSPTLVLLVCLSACTPLIVAQIKRTIDDASPLIKYNPAASLAHNITTGFLAPRLYNGTVAVLNSSLADPVKFILQFTGTNIYLFIAKPLTTAPLQQSFNIVVDGGDAEHVLFNSTDDAALYGYMAYSKQSLPLASHTLEMDVSGGAIVFFDYATYTSPTAEPQPEPAPHAKIPVAPIVGGTVGAALLLACAIAVSVFVRRRRRAQGRPRRVKSETSDPRRVLQLLEEHPHIEPYEKFPLYDVAARPLSAAATPATSASERAPQDIAEEIRALRREVTSLQVERNLAGTADVEIPPSYETV